MFYNDVMAETQASFLCKIASTLSSEKDAHILLRSHYLMQCKKIARSINLPQKQFSSLTRCPHCCLEWKQGTKVNLKPIKLSKRQRHRIKKLKHSNINKFNKKEILLHGNKLEQICSFCGYNTLINLKKPDKPLSVIKNDESEEGPFQENLNSRKLLKINAKNKSAKSSHNDNNISKNKNNFEINVYSNTHEVFALNNKANTLPIKVKDSPKVIKNSKRKKDKFAGLCKKAVLASAKLKEEQQKHNKLSLFLKPST